MLLLLLQVQQLATFAACVSIYGKLSLMYQLNAGKKAGERRLLAQMIRPAEHTMTHQSAPTRRKESLGGERSTLSQVDCVGFALENLKF